MAGKALDDTYILHPVSEVIDGSVAEPVGRRFTQCCRARRIVGFNVISRAEQDGFDDGIELRTGQRSLAFALRKATNQRCALV